LVPQLKDCDVNKFVTCFLRDETGVTAIEYGLIAALIYNNIGNALAAAL